MLVWNENYRPLPKACSADAVVRIQPDDWPSFASQAWTTVELAQEHSRLEAMVVAEDRDKVSPKRDATSSPRCSGE